MARWITVRTPFNFHWPDRAAVTHYAEPGDYFAKDEVADFAVEKGYATEGKADGTSRSTKSGPKRVRKSRKKEAPAAPPADDRSIDPVAQPDMAVHDRAADRSSVDRDAG